MGKLMVGVARILPLCAVLLVLPALASAQIGPMPPTVTLSFTPKSIIAGQSATISWTVTNATSLVSSCIASGDWSGTKLTSGSESVTPNKPGTTKYTLTCTDAAGGTSSPSSVLLTTQTTVN